MYIYWHHWMNLHTNRTTQFLPAHGWDMGISDCFETNGSLSDSSWCPVSFGFLLRSIAIEIPSKHKASTLLSNLSPLVPRVRCLALLTGIFWGAREGGYKKFGKRVSFPSAPTSWIWKMSMDINRSLDIEIVTCNMCDMNHATCCDDAQLDMCSTFFFWKQRCEILSTSQSWTVVENKVTNNKQITSICTAQ